MTEGPDEHEVTRLLARWQHGDTSALDRLAPVVYAELKALASRALAHERQGHTLQTTALVNEAFLRLAAQQSSPSDRAHLLALAAQAMRRVLVDHARRHKARKRPTSDERVAIDEVDLPEAEDIDLLQLDAALERLAAISPRQARVVDLKFFTGLELEQIADVLDIARPTVVRDWRMARAWLQRELA